MKRILLLLSVLLLFIGGVKAQPATDSADYRITPEHLKLSDGLRLNKPWRYHVGDSLEWSKPGYDNSHWMRIATQFDEQQQVQLKKDGFTHIAWFRTSLYFDSTVIHKPIAIKIDNAGAMAVYLNGELLDTYGSFEKKGKYYYENQEAPILLNIKEAGRYELAVRYENKAVYKDEDAIFASKGFAVSILSGEVALWRSVQKLWLLSISLLPIGFVFLTLFFVHLLLFLYYRQDKSNLYFALFNLGAASLMILLFAMLNTEDVLLQRRLSGVWITGILLSVFALSTFINHLFGSFGWRYKIIVCLSLLSLVAFFFFLNNDVFSFIPLFLFLFVALEAVVLIIRAIIRKKPGAKILGIGILFFFGSIAFITLIVSITGGFTVGRDDVLAGIALAIFLILFVFSLPLSISGYLAWKFAGTNQRLQQQITTVEQLSREKQAILENQKEELEKEVEIRTHEIIRQKQLIEEEKQKTDELLLNILPGEVAEELKREGKSKAQYFNEVSVLFTDFVNFTHIAEQLQPEELIAELNICFTAFDNIMEQYGLEKIKTIGDAYLAVSGLPIQNPMHAHNAVNAALDIVAFVNGRNAANTLGFEIRVGINSGPLVAGIVGVKKFAYDIWGDTVNVASRMETNSESGRVNISESTYVLVQHDFKFTYRGKVNAKNKGAVDMYFVEALKPDTL